MRYYGILWHNFYTTHKTVATLGGEIVAFANLEETHSMQKKHRIYHALQQ